MGAEYYRCEVCGNTGKGSEIYICKSCGRIAGCAIWINKGPLGLLGHQEGCLRNQTCNSCGTSKNYDMIGKIQ